MKTMKWLVLREIWEHKGALFWAPIVVGLLMVVSVGTTVIYGIASNQFLNTRVEVRGQSTDVKTIVTQVAADETAQMAHIMATSFMAASVPLFLMLAVVVFFYCLGAMYDERRDRSILFWKSLPLSDRDTVLSKVITALVVAPLITIAVGTAVSLTLLLLACVALAFAGINVFGAVLSNPALYLAPFQLLALLPIYVLWALPTVGWLLMVSAWARSKVFLWAVGAPLLTLGVIGWASYLLGININMDWVGQHIIGRGLTGLIPGIWLPIGAANPDAMVSAMHNSVDMWGVLSQSWLTLAGAQMWIGVCAGAAMIFAAMRLRRWKDEG